IDRGVNLWEKTVNRPGLCPRRRIAHREFISECLRTHEREAFDKLHPVARSSPVSIFVKVGCFDHESIALPMASRISQPQTDTLRQMWTPVQWNDAGVVVRLDHDHHVSGCLNDLRLRGDAARNSWWPSIPGDATRVQTCRRDVNAFRAISSGCRGL